MRDNKVQQQPDRSAIEKALIGPQFAGANGMVMPFVMPYSKINGQYSTANPSDPGGPRIDIPKQIARSFSKELMVQPGEKTPSFDYNVLNPDLSSESVAGQDSGIRPDGMLSPDAGGLPTDGGMAAGMPMQAPMAGQMQNLGMQQPNPMQNPMQKRGLGALMARLSGRSGGGI